MVRKHQSRAQLRARRQNIKKAIRANKQHGGRRYRTPAQRRAARKNIIRARYAQAMRGHRSMRGGMFNPAMLLAAHNTLQQFKPLTKLTELGDALGVSEPISKFLDKSSVGRFVKRGFNGIKNVLGYGRRRRSHHGRRHRKRGYGRRRRHVRRVRVSRHLRQAGGSLVVVRGHLKRARRHYRRR